jgi:acyl dehydratase
VLEVTGASRVINFGLDRLRFPARGPAGARVRMRIDLVAVDQIDCGLHVRLGLSFELEGGQKPACVAEILFRYYV